MKAHYILMNKVIEIIAPVEFDILLLKQQIPGIEKATQLLSNIHIKVQFEESNTHQIEYTDQKMIIQSVWNKIWLTDFPHLLYSYLKYVFVQEEIYFLHSTVIDKTLYLGHSGAGKTTLAKNAILNNIPVYSTDKTGVSIKYDRLYVETGTDIFSIRDRNSNTRILDTDTKINHDTHMTLQKIAVFKINNMCNTVLQIKGMDKTHQLYPWFLDTTKTDCFVQNGKLLFSPTINQFTKKELFHSLTTLTTPFYFIEGSIKQLLEWSKNG